MIDLRMSLTFQSEAERDKKHDAEREIFQTISHVSSSWRAVYVTPRRACSRRGYERTISVALSFFVFAVCLVPDKSGFLLMVDLFFPDFFERNIRLSDFRVLCER